MSADQKSKIIFALSPSDVGPILTLGISEAAWDYMRDGKTHTFDLTSLGVPMKLMLFGAKTQEAALQTLKAAAARQDIPLLDRRHKDFSIK
jgi:hypothetical protein